MRAVRLSLLVAAVMCFTLLTNALASGEIRVVIEGSKQGQFKSETGGKDAAQAALAYRYEISSPRDAASGQASGKRMHSPVVLTRPVGAASPQLFQALATNEVLKSVQIDVLDSRTSAILYRIRLINASVSKIEQMTDAEGRLMENVSFTFQRIEFEHPGGKTTATDDWTQRV